MIRNIEFGRLEVEDELGAVSLTIEDGDWANVRLDPEEVIQLRDWLTQWLATVQTRRDRE